MPKHNLPLPLILLVLAMPAAAQIFERPTALPPADLELLDAASAAHLESAKRFLAESQWDEGVESIRRVMEADAGKLVRVEMSLPVAGFERYVPASEYCQWRLAALADEAPPALAHYRQLVDSLAEGWLKQGIAERSEPLLSRVVSQAFASRSGDDALLALGDLALVRGDHATARAHWRRILGSKAAAKTVGQYPDTDLTPGDVAARLVLASILEGSLGRAKAELDQFRQRHAESQGTLAGQSGQYFDLLAAQLAAAATWQPAKNSADWLTFAGNPRRDKIAPAAAPPAGQLLWSFALPKLTSDREIVGAGRLRAADDMKGLLSYFPVVAGQTVLIRGDARQKSYVVALDLRSGHESWRVDYPRGVLRQPAAELPAEPDGPFQLSDAHADLVRHVGVARFTATVSGHKAIVRMGSPITAPSPRRMNQWLSKDQGFLLGLDLATQGKPLEGFPIRPESSAWSFEGTPILDGGAAYVVMRRGDGARSQLYVAAFDLPSTAMLIDDEDDNARPTGRLKWRTRICSAATLGGGDLDEVSHLLLTLAGGKLYLNTSAGVVAALAAEDGRVQWVVKYPRSAFRSGNPDAGEQQFFRDLTPCLAWKDLLIVAPGDSDRLFALVAATGELAWTLPPGAAADAVHLLGIGQDTLLVSGDWLYWIDAQSGRLWCQFPSAGPIGAGQAAPSPRGLGRGVLGGSHVYFPTRETIYVFDQRPAATDFGSQPRLVRQIPLAPRGLTGGNLLISGGVLLIATGDRLVAFGE
ncbi:MAG: PQQ-binding-like beta-propeller repeat protein [Pirellulaceae bacterium]|nr:PQQ-binding-like beta-propeller repeat protein [Pirellulaceae bacterium]